MDITAKEIVRIIEAINRKKAANMLVGKPKVNETPNYPIGVDSIAYMLKVQVDQIQPLIDQMIAFEVLEMVSQKHRHNGGSPFCKKVKLVL